MTMAPSVESSSFSQYSSNPTPPPTSQPGVGTGGWFKEHALIILLGVIALVAVLWFIARRSSSSSLSSDNSGYPLGYPNAGTGTSGGSGASSGGSGSGSGDTGTGATASDQALKDFMAGFALRDGQVNSGGNTTATQAPIPLDVHVTQDPLSVNITGSPGLPGVQGSSGVQGQPGPQGLSGIQPLVNRTPTPSLAVSPQGTTAQAHNFAKAGGAPMLQAVANQAVKAVYGSNYELVPSAGTHVATTNKPKPAPKKTPPPKKNKKPVGHTRGHEEVY